MIGIFSKTTDSNLVEAAGLAGLDFIIIDQEHGPVSEEQLRDHIRAARLTGMKAIVRVRELNHNAIGSALDAGADGVQVPNISNAEQARDAINAARFHPLGNRGVCRFVGAADFGAKDKRAYFEEANKKLLILQVEGREGVENINDILSVTGFDVLFVGPYDLSQALGVPGEVGDKIVLNEIEKIRKEAESKKISIGSFSDTPEMLLHQKSLGFSMLAYGVDIDIFRKSCIDVKKILPNG